MNKKNSKKNLLKEEVNRFKNILENSFLFYEDNETEEPKEDLLLGNLYKEEEGGEEEPLEVSDEDINPPEEGEEPTDDLEDDSDDSEGFGDGEEFSLVSILNWQFLSKSRHESSLNCPEFKPNPCYTSYSIFHF